MTDNNCDTSLQHITHIKLSYVSQGRITNQGLVNQHVTMDQTREFFNPKCCYLSFNSLLQLGVSIRVLLCYNPTGLDRCLNATTVTKKGCKVTLKKQWIIYWFHFI